MRIEHVSGIDARQYAEYARTASTQAAVLRSAAIRVEQAAANIAYGFGVATFNTPSAVRFRIRSNEAVYDLRSDVARLNTLAETLDRLSQHFLDLYRSGPADRFAGR